MLGSKIEIIESRESKLSRYTKDLDIYKKEYNKLGNQLFNRETNTQALRSIIQIINNLHAMIPDLSALHQISKNRRTGELIIDHITNASILEQIKCQILLKRATTRLFDVKSCALITLSEDNQLPTFESIQPKLGWYLDAIIFHKNQTYYVNQCAEKIQPLLISEENQSNLLVLKKRCREQANGFAYYSELSDIISDTDIRLSILRKVSYIPIIVEFIEPLYSSLQFKNDIQCQQDIYFAFSETIRQMQDDKIDSNTQDQYYTTLQAIIDKFSDNMTILTYYYFTLLHGLQVIPDVTSYAIRACAQKFSQHFDNFMNSYRRLKQENKLTAHHKINYINAHSYASEIKLRLHPKLQSTSFENALLNKKYIFIQDYTQIAISTKNDYLNKEIDLILCHDIQDIVDDLSAVAGYLYATGKASHFLSEQIKYILACYNESKNFPNLSPQEYLDYKERIYQEIISYKNIMLQHSTCKNLLIQYLAGDNTHLTFDFEFDAKYSELLPLIEDFENIHTKSKILNNTLLSQKIEQVKLNEQALITEHTAERAKKLRRPKTITPQPEISKKTPQKIQPKKDTKQTIQTQEVEKDEIDSIIDQGRDLIAKSNYQNAHPLFRKAYNLALIKQDKKKQLSALDCICSTEGHLLQAQLKSIEKLAQYTTVDSKEMLKEEINALIFQLPKLRLHYKQYCQLAESLSKSLESSQLEGITYTKKYFWDQLLSIQRKLDTLKAQQTKKPNQPIQTKKSTASKKKNQVPTNNFASEIEYFQIELEKQFDNLATEREIQRPFEKPAVKQSVLKIKLPVQTVQFFNCLDALKGKHYLVGSTVVQLLQQHFNIPSLTPHDVDFISTCTDNSAFLRSEFTKNNHKENLYCKYNVFNQSLDVVSIQETDNWLMDSLLSRDFRLASLCIEKDSNDEGILIDPTGKGLEDLLAKRLTMIGCPKERMKQDAVLLLRTIKYIMFGFEPDEQIIEALNTWQPSLETNYSQLYAVTRKLLLKPEGRGATLKQMNDYGLIKKCFKQDCESDLLTLLGINTIYRPTNSHGFFTPLNQNNIHEGSSLSLQKK